MTEETFAQALERRILLFDGAMGTEIQKHQPKPEDFPDNKDGFNDGLSQTRPELIKTCLLYTSPSPRDQRGSRMPSSA